MAVQAAGQGLTGTRDGSGGFMTGDDDYGGDDFKPLARVKSENDSAAPFAHHVSLICKAFLPGFCKFHCLAPSARYVALSASTSDGDNHGDDDALPKDARPESSWKDVCYASFAIPRR